LKTILPLSDELGDILGMTFEHNPEDRITIDQLKRRIFQCSSFTIPNIPASANASTLQSTWSNIPIISSDSTFGENWSDAATISSDPKFDES
jgi:hypothetical protein